MFRNYLRSWTSSQPVSSQAVQESSSNPAEPRPEDLTDVSERLGLETGNTEALIQSDDHFGNDSLRDVADLEDQLMQDIASSGTPKSESTTGIKAPKKKMKKTGRKKGKRDTQGLETSEENSEVDGGVENGASSEDASPEVLPVFEHIEEDENMLRMPPPKTISREPNGKFSKNPKKGIKDLVTSAEHKGSKGKFDPVALLNEARSHRDRSNAAKSKRASMVSDMVSEEGSISPQEHGNSNGIALNGKLPRSMNEVSQKAKKSSRPTKNVPAEDSPHMLATPTSFSRLVVEIPFFATNGTARSTPLSEEHAHMASGVSEGEEDETPIYASNKALGKRKAVDTASGSSSKKRKRIIDKGPPNKDVRTFFTPAAHSDPESINTHFNMAQNDNDEMQDMEDEPSLFVSPVRIPPTFTYAKHSARSATSRPSWNAVNKPIEALEDESEDIVNSSPASEVAQAPNETPIPPPQLISAIVPEPAKQRRKRRLPVDDPNPASTKQKGSARSGKKLDPKTPKNPKKAARKTNGVQPHITVSGRLTDQDTQAIIDAVDAFRSVQDLSKVQLNEMVQQSARDAAKEAKDFWESVCKEVPWVPTRKVYEYCRRKYHNFGKRSEWTAEQDEELRVAYESNPNKWTIIGRAINRLPEDVRDRWRNYVICGDSMKTEPWTQEEEDQLSLAVEECILTIQAARRRSGGLRLVGDDEKYIDWNKVSEKMDHTRSRLQCSQKWKALKQRQDPEGEEEVTNTPISNSWRLDKAYSAARVLSAEQKLRLLHAIRGSGAAHEGKIPWGIIRDQVDKDETRMTWRVCYRGLKERVAGHENMKFGEILDELIDAFEAASPNEPDGLTIARPVKAESSQKPKVTSTRRKNKTLQSGNGEGPSNSSNTASKGKKFRERMRREDESTQETDMNGMSLSENESPTADKRERTGRNVQNRKDQSAHSGAAEDAEHSSAAIHPLKKSTQPRKPRVVRAAKTPINQVKRTQRKPISEEIVVEDPSDDDDINNHAAPSRNENEMEVDEPAGPSNPYNHNTTVTSEAEERNGLSNSPLEERDLSDEQEDTDAHLDAESIDLDSTKNILSSGNHSSDDDEDEEPQPDMNEHPLDGDVLGEEDELEASHHDTESLELDADETIMRNGHHLSSEEDENSESAIGNLDIEGLENLYPDEDEDEDEDENVFENRPRVLQSLNRDRNSNTNTTDDGNRDGNEDEDEDADEDEEDLETSRHDTESVDLDTPIPEFHGPQVNSYPGPPLLFRGWSESNDSDDQSVSSDTSSIPATRPIRPRMESVEL